MKKITLSIISLIAAAASVGARDFAKVKPDAISMIDAAKAQERIEMFHRAPSTRSDSPIESRDDLLGAWIEYYNSPGNIYGDPSNLWANHFIINAGLGENEIYLQNLMNEKYLQVAATVNAASGYVDIQFPQLVGYDGSAAVYLYSYDMKNNATLTDGTITLTLQRNEYDNKLEFMANLPMLFYAEYQGNMYLMDMSCFITAKQPNGNIAYKNAQTAGTPTEADFKPIDYRIDVIPGFNEKDEVVAMQVSTVTANGTGIPVIFSIDENGVGTASGEVGDYQYGENYNNAANGYYQLFSILNNNSASATVQGKFNEDRNKFEFNPAYNWMLYDASRGLYQGENTPATITLDVPFPPFSKPAAIDTVEVDEQGDAEYYDMFGRRVMNPAPGQMLIRRQGQKATKVIID